MLGCWLVYATAADNYGKKVDAYTRFWRSALAKSSGISESELTSRIQIEKTGIDDWSAGKTFRVSYTVRIDWLTIQRQDEFIVWINESENMFRNLGLPRNTWLSDSDLKTVIAKNAFNAAIGRVNPKMKLAFASLDEAKAFVCEKHNLASLDVVRTGFLPELQARQDGMPYLYWSKILDKNSNKAITGTLNLVTKEAKSREGAFMTNSTFPGGRI
jgi:hypothetical protein